MEIIFSVHWMLIIAIWYTGSGLLHDIFVLKQHTGKYNRDLLRLLMDGHVLILSGVIEFVCYQQMLLHQTAACIISIVVGAFMLLYCLMIFPFLKSFLTMALSFILIIVSLKNL